MARKRNSKSKKNRRKASKDKSNLSQSTTSLSSTDSTHSSSSLEQQNVVDSTILENNGIMTSNNLIRNVDQQQTNSLLLNNNNNINGTISSTSNSIPILISSGNEDTSIYTRRSAVTSRWIDEQDFSPASSPINNIVVVDERHEVKMEILEKSNSSHHHHMSSSLIDAQFDEQFERATTRKVSKKKLTVASWSASSIEGEQIEDDNKSTIQKIGEQAPDLILLQDVNYGQLIKSLKCLKKAEEHLEMKHEETMTDSEDNEPPIYKWFCCGHKDSFEPSKLDETIENSEERDEDIPMIQSTSTSIISRFLKNEVSNRETEDRDADDFVTEYLPIIYNSERLKCVDCGVYWFSKNHKEAGTKSWDSLVPRFCNWAAFVFKPYDEEGDEEYYKDFIVFNTHWDQGVEARRYSAQSMRQEIIGKMSNYNLITNKTTIIPTITVGNFNSLPKSNALSILVTGTDLGAHNNDDQTKPIDSDSDSDDLPTPYDRESLITPCQRQLSASMMDFEKTETRQSTTSSEENHDNEEDESSESESYSGTWYHNVAFEPTFVDQETKESTTLDYVFISPCVKTLDFQLLDTNTSTESQYHKPSIATFEL